MKKHFKAPWETKLKVLTGIFLSVLGFIIIFHSNIFSTLFILAIIFGCAAFTVHGYSVQDGKLLVHRLGWAKEFDLKKLQKIDVTPDAMIGSVRTWGIGGLFGYIGYFRNSTLGIYRAYATNSKNTVVLEFEKGKIVVTPDSPKEFEEAIDLEKLV